MKHLIVVLTLLLLAATAPARAAEGTGVRIGPTVDVTGTVPGRVIAGAGSITVEGRVAGDMMALAGRMNVTGTVEGDLTAASGAFTLWPQGQVGGDLHLAAGDAEISGAIGGDLVAATGSITVAGQVGGDVRVGAGKLVVLPGAVIGGRIVTHGPGSVQISPEAKVLGGTAPSGPPAPMHREHRSGDMPFALIGTALLFTFLRLPVVGIGTLAVGLLFLALFPRFAGDAALVVRRRPAASILMGFFGMAASPVIVAILILTILGLPLALFVAAAFMLALVVGYGIGAATLTSLVLRSRRPASAEEGEEGKMVLPPRFVWRAVYLLIGLAALGFLRHLPVAGIFTLWGTTALGFGALLLETSHRWSRA
ncbi:MAG TPA: polymer-forming cytoskeletal protein [Alphaproteobacteria bacterium]|nr:polymer-forming cytoskeletal protein [Alphaproteobacteria bacterium]